MRTATRDGFALVIFLCVLAVPALGRADTWEVAANGQGEVATIQDAVNAATFGDTIVLQPGTYTGSGNWDIDLQNKTLVIRSTDPLDPNVVAATVIDCAGSPQQHHRGFFVAFIDGAVLSGLTITNGLRADGGAIHCVGSTLEVTHCRLLGNGTPPGEPGSDKRDAGHGGALYVDDSTVTVRECTIRGNATGAGAPRLAAEAIPAGDGGNGGAVYISDSTVHIVDCEINENAAGRGGDGGTFQGGRGGDGGAIYCLGDSDVEIVGSSIQGNAAGAGGLPFGAGGAGGGICSLPGVTLEITDCDVLDNLAAGGGAASAGAFGRAGVSGNGGGLFCYDAVIRSSRIHGNATSDGVSVASGGAAGGSGGGLYSPARVRLLHCSVRNNFTGNGGRGDEGGGFGGNGGGVRADTIVASDCTFADNRTGDGASQTEGRKAGSAGHGGGVYCVHAVLSRCVLTGNRTGDGAPGTDAVDDGDGGDGGGLYCISGTLTSNLIAGNRTGAGGGLFHAGRGGRGAGIYCGEGDLNVTNCTLTENVTGDDVAPDPQPSGRGRGAGIFTRGSLAVRNTILWANRPDELAGHDCNEVAYSDVAGRLCAAGEGNIDADPLFVQPGSWLAVHDPSIRVEPESPDAVWVAGAYGLQAGSPCIDAGDPNHGLDPNATDVVGGPRVFGRGIDIGAYESRGVVPVYRFWSATLSRHFYTADEAEKEAFIRDFPDVWILEDVAYYAYDDPTEPNVAPVYRFWSKQTSAYFYTIRPAERDRLLKEFSDVWEYQGEAFYAFPEGEQPADAAPVYRFWSDSAGTHFYTTSERERDKLVEQHADVWTFEGIAWYAYPRPTDR